MIVTTCNLHLVGSFLPSPWSFAGNQVYGLAGSRRRYGIKDHSSGVLDGFQALAQEVGISIPDLNVVSRRGSVFESDGLADHKRHGFGFGFADWNSSALMDTV